MKIPKYISEDGIPVFTNENFFKDGENVFIQMSTEFPDFVGVMHKHEFIEVVYILSGQAVHKVDGYTTKACKGDLFIINNGVAHAFYGDTEIGENFYSYDLMFTKDFFDLSMINENDFNSLGSSFLFYSMFSDKKDIGPILQLSGNSYNIFGELFNKIYLEYNNHEKGYINMIRAYVIELIITIFRRMDYLAPHSSIKHSEIINITLDYLKKNYNTHITVSELASRIFLSKDYFSKLFKDVTGTSVGIFLKQIRLNESCEQLKNTNRKITDIAEDCGFNDMKFFYRAFKQFTGETPGSYREKNYKNYK